VAAVGRWAGVGVGVCVCVCGRDSENSAGCAYVKYWLSSCSCPVLNSRAGLFSNIQKLVNKRKESNRLVMTLAGLGSGGPARAMTRSARTAPGTTGRINQDNGKATWTSAPPPWFSCHSRHPRRIHYQFIVSSCTVSHLDAPTLSLSGRRLPKRRDPRPTPFPLY
jgi:hypothetical protein